MEEEGVMAEVADIVIEEARELVSNRLLWPLVRDFLWDFAPQIHESWIVEKFRGLEVWKFRSLKGERRTKWQLALIRSIFR